MGFGFRHRHFGRANANQILLAMVTTVLWFIALMQESWITLPDDAHVGLWKLYINDSSNETTWEPYCEAKNTNIAYLVQNDNGVYVPLPLDPALPPNALCKYLGGKLVPVIVRALLILTIVFAIAAILGAMYFSLGTASPVVVRNLGSLPGFSLLVSASIGVSLFSVWDQQYNSEFDMGDSYRVAIAASVIGYLVGVSMLVTWFYPGICAVPSEMTDTGIRYSWSETPADQPRRLFRYSTTRIA